MNLFSGVILIAIVVASLAALYITYTKIQRLNTTLRMISQKDNEIVAKLCKIFADAHSNLPAVNEGEYPKWYQSDECPLYSAKFSGATVSNGYEALRSSVEEAVWGFTSEGLDFETRRWFEEKLEPTLRELREVVERRDQMALILSNDPILGKVVEHLPQPFITQKY
jgi:hypothetical protein